MPPLIESTSQSTYLKRQKRSLPDDMPYFATSSNINMNNNNHFLGAPMAPLLHKKSRSTGRFITGGIDISSDLEISFASNVSLNSPPRDNVSLPSDCEPMDISPAPPIKPMPSILDLQQVGSSTRPSRPRAFTSGARLFGADISNSSSNKSLLPSPQLVGTSSGLKPEGSARSSAKKIQRSALPTEWLAPAQPEVPSEPSSPMDDAMDVDTSYNADVNPSALSFSPVPQSAAPTITGFNQLFYDTLSPRRSYESPSAHLPKKQRRSLSPESARRTSLKHDHALSSSPAEMHSSPSEARLERIASKVLPGHVTKPSLQGLGAPSASFLKRPRRPVLSAMVQPSDHPIQSAYPILSPLVSGDSNGTSTDEDNSPRGSAPARRAFSAFLPPSVYTEPEEEETSFEGPDMSSPAQAYSKRQQVKTIRRCDGTEDFRPLTGVTALTQKESPSAKFMAAAGLPGFGDNEAHGKILPCHRVTEDGLMRIKPQTLDDLLDGKYCDLIVDFHIIDCRFDYEYTGGHIPGAVNINTTAAVEEALLAGMLKPKPSVSGDSGKKTILVFHCEFSAKRAPTFAKHLRAKDRAMNHHVYPKIHYPEVYVLEGGYSQYFKVSGQRCEPPAYVPMDDPKHAISRREDLDQFRRAKFGRHKSYAYGDNKPLPFGQQVQQQPKRNTAPSAPQSLFAAATAARSRRGGGSGPISATASLMTLVEDGHGTQDGGDTDTDTDLGDSPCPPPVKATMMKGKKMAARGMVRSETYGPSKMNW